MSKQSLNFDAFVTLDEAKKAIMLYGSTITQTIISEPGVAKSSLLKMIAEENGDKWREIGDHYPDDKFVYVYVECPVKDVPDMWMGIPVADTGRIVTAISELFQMDDPRPKYIMLDEALKANKMMQIIFSRIKLERVVGDRKLPKGTTIFSTSNNPTDGVGDSMQAHAINRETILYMLKPSTKQWVRDFALKNNIHDSLCSWALFNPRAGESYMTLSREKLDANDMIFSPYRPTQPFLSYRSLTHCDPIVRNRHIVGDNLTRAALYGTVGKSAGESIMQHLDIVKDLVAFDDIVQSPETVNVPQSMGAQIHILVNAIRSIETQDHLSQFLKFVVRLHSNELQSLFNSMIATSDKKGLASRNPDIQKWMMTNKNYELLA